MTGLLGTLSQFSAAHPWSHNDAYYPWIIRHAWAVRRRGGDTALDVGCGTGHLLERLAGVLPVVVGLEPDPRTAARAHARVAEMQNATVLEGTFSSTTLDQTGFDLVTFVAVLHHLPLARTLEAARSLIRPGGRLVIVGLTRETKADLAWSLASMLLNPVIGMISHPRRANDMPEIMTAPTSEPMETFEQISATARRVLPGVKMRRGLFWRYTAVWVRTQS